MHHYTFNIGDVVEVLPTGHKGLITGKPTLNTFEVDGDTDNSWYEDQLSILVVNNQSEFNIYDTKWVIYPKSLEHSIAAQKWLFTQGIIWGSGADIQYEYFTTLTNTTLAGIATQRLMSGDCHPSCVEITLQYETTVIEILYPDGLSNSQKEIEKVRRAKRDLDIKLKELIDKCRDLR